MKGTLPIRGKPFYLSMLILFMALLAPQAPARLFEKAGAGQGNAKITYKITGDVYYGDKNRFNAPCVLTRETVFKAIPAYQKIGREGLDKNSARYYFLLEEANKAFRDSVKETAVEKGYDLVVEKGGIKPSEKMKFTDITQAVVDNL